MQYLDRVMNQIMTKIQNDDQYKIIVNLGIFILASDKIWHHKISFFSKIACYFIPEFKGSTKLIPKPLMITLTRVMTKTRIVMMSLRMSATFSLGSSLMLNPPITRKRIPTSAWKVFGNSLYVPVHVIFAVFKLTN